MTYEQAKALKLIERPDMVSPCWDCVHTGPIVTSEKGTVYHKGCQHPKVLGSCDEAWRCWHPIQRNNRGVELPRKECEWLIYFEPVPEFRPKYEKVINKQGELEL